MPDRASQPSYSWLGGKVMHAVPRELANIVVVVHSLKKESTSSTIQQYKTLLLVDPSLDSAASGVP